MNTLEQLRADMKDAMRAKDELTLLVIRSVFSACTNELVAKGKKPTDTLDEKEVIAVLRRLVKQRIDAAEQFTAGNRPELAEKEVNERKVLEKYVPQQASRAQIEAAAKDIIAAEGSDPAKMGMYVGKVMKALDGNADGNVVKEVLANLLK